MPRRRQPSLHLILFSCLIGLLACSAVFAFLFLRSITRPVTAEPTPRIEFVVNRGDTTLDIAASLYAAGLIRSPLGFRYVVKKEGLGDELQSGTYYLSANFSAQEIARSLTRGVSDLRLVIPEGYRVEEIAATAAASLDFTAADFVAAARAQEGYLFPDTYFVAPTTTAEELVSLMTNNFAKRVGEIDRGTLILASLVERETKGSEEKPFVAGILAKRLAAGWALELDATVQYALGKTDDWWPRTTLADRRVDSPYNTYLATGLPPGPICNPGLESIQAARSPQASDSWFYLHGRDGFIRYAKTLEEHNRNIDQYLR